MGRAINKKFNHGKMEAANPSTILKFDFLWPNGQFIAILPLKLKYFHVSCSNLLCIHVTNSQSPIKYNNDG